MLQFNPKILGREDVERCRNLQGAHRISFSTTHKGQPARGAGAGFVGKFAIPFEHTVQRVFGADTGLDLHSSRFGGVWRSIKTEAEFTTIQAWVERQGTRVFLRDCLDLSITLDQNLMDNKSGTYTALGDLEARAKGDRDEAAIAALVDRYCAAIGDLPGYRDARHIAAVPARPGKRFDLPSVIATRVARRRGLMDLTAQFIFDGEKAAIKTLDVAQKWDALEQSGLRFDGALKDSPQVILIDDKYQSGLTIQFVASRLYAAGAGEVFGLCAVKTLRDDDNV